VTHFAAVLRGGSPRPAWFLVGLCEDLLTPSPLGAIHDLALLAPEQARTALLAELARTSPGPVVLVVEDVHWADDASFDTVRHLWRRTEQVKMLTVSALRSLAEGTPFDAATLAEVTAATPAGRTT